VKVLDFGLAKVFAHEQSNPSSSHSPTLPGETLGGAIFGTAAYMAPEQAKGKPADSRSDIWSFGAVMYEMLTGKPVFEGETVVEILGSVIKSEPDWAALPAETPANIRFVLRRCLEKDPKRRFHSAADVQIQIEETMAAPGISADRSAPRKRVQLLTKTFIGLAVYSRALLSGNCGLRRVDRGL
jgi:serine/threonine protein kinase